ncbi:hypothetical protein CRUP_014497, partial [Coryphaenoides rupestris]
KINEQDDSSQRLLIEIKDDGDPVQSTTRTVSMSPFWTSGTKRTILTRTSGRIALYLILSLASVSVLSLVTFLILAVKCIKSSRSSGSCCMRRSDSEDYKNPNRNLQIQLNTDGPIKYVEVLGGDMMSQSQSFRSCLSPMSEYSDFTFVKPSSTTDFKDMINVLDASLPDSTWTFESQQRVTRDEGLNGEVEYSFGIHTPENVMGLFNMNAVTGEIFLKGLLDYENAVTYRIDISAKDKGVPKMEGHCRVQIDVIDVNDNTPEVMLTSQPNDAPEDAPSGTVVALLSARDLDSGANGNVTLQLPARSPFSLKPSFANNYALVTNGVLDREVVSHYNIEITATDAGSPPLNSRKIIPVKISDINDNAPMFSQPSYNVYIKENGRAGTIIYSLTASDLDLGENAKVSYSILDSKVQDVSVSSY